MSSKPTYEELEQRIKKLDNEVRADTHSKEDLGRIFTLSLDMICSGNLEGYFTKVNSSFEKILGYTEEEFLKEPFFSFVHQEDVEKTTEALVNPGKGNRTIFIDNRYKCKDGSYKWIEWRAQTLSEEKKFIAVGRDVTERKKAEETLAFERSQLLSIFDSIDEVIYVTDPSTYEILYMNQAVKDAFQKELIGGICYREFQGFDSPCDFCTNDIILKQKPVPHLWEHHNPNLDKDYAIVDRIIKWPDGRDVRFEFARDITEQKNAEGQLQKAFSEISELKNQLEEENVYLREQIKIKYKHEDIVAQSNGMKKALYAAEQVAETNAAVLLMGETGTGKGLLSRFIHRVSSRKDNPMITVNCAALSPTLIEGELFGHEKGAYTGALTKRIGRFELANGSTIFLDEVSEIPMELQAKLLRVLETGEFERLGSSKTIHADVRVIAATNRDLAEKVKNGTFREDLYYRLNVFQINIPPLRKRPEDIPLLVWSFVREFSKAMGKKIDTIPRKKMDTMQRYFWPGNVRELRNFIERSMILTKGKTLFTETPKNVVPENITNRTLADVERKHIIKVLKQTAWRVSGKNGAAEILGLKPTTLDARMKKLGIQRP